MDGIASCRDYVVSHAISSSPVERHNLHMTLAFLGEQEPETADDIIDAMDAVSLSSFSLTFDHFGSFTIQGKELWWLGCEPCPALNDLEADLRRELHTHSIHYDKKPFVPHITLARKVRLRQGPFARLEKPFTGEVQRLVLFLSHRIKGVLTYTPLYGRDI